MKKNLFFSLIVLACMSAGLSAQVNGIATDPIVSEDPANPVYFYIESASDSSFVLAGYSGDFRGGRLFVCEWWDSSAPAGPEKVISLRLWDTALSA